MNFSQPQTESKLIKRLSGLKVKLKNFFKSKIASINLIDPQRRIEDILITISKETENDAKSIERIIKDQLEVMDIKISSTNRSLETILQRILSNTAENFTNVKYNMDDQKKSFLSRLCSIEKNLDTLATDFKDIKVDPKSLNSVLTKLQVDEKINTKIKSSHSKLEREIIYMKLEIDALFKSMLDSVNNHMNELRNTMELNEASVRSNLNEMSLIQKRELQLIHNKISEVLGKSSTREDEMEKNSVVSTDLKNIEEINVENYTDNMKPNKEP